VKPLLNGGGFEIAMAILLGILIIYLLFRLLAYPFRLIFALVLKVIVGLVLLLGFNLVGAWLGVTIGINPVTVLVTGLLGVPGLFMLAVLQYLF